MIVPYRNTKCRLLDCLYDEDEVIEMAKKIGKEALFPCSFCKTKIQIENFWLDEDMYEVIGRLFSCYNKTDVVVREIIIYRKGNYKPILLKKPGEFFQIDDSIPDIH